MDKKPGGPRPTLHSVKIDRKAFSVGSVLEPSDEKAYWLSKTPHERLQAAELMRQIVYGYDPATTRLQRVLEIAQRPQNLADLERLP
jgi:hypothetical protein